MIFVVFDALLAVNMCINYSFFYIYYIIINIILNYNAQYSFSLTCCRANDIRKIKSFMVFIARQHTAVDARY